jgi:hypothetical protein
VEATRPLVGILMVPMDPLIAADVERFGIRQVVPIPAHPRMEEIVAQRARDKGVVIFASPRRRWSEVMEAVRAAAGTVAGQLALRFYQPTVTIDVRMTSAGPESWFLYPVVAEFDAGTGAKAYSVCRAVRAGVADLEREAQRQKDAAFLAHGERLRLAGRL